MHGTDLHPARSARELTTTRAILLDIEGTTTPLEFVQQVLFPYARARVREYVERHAANPGVIADIAALRAEHAAEPPTAAGLPAWDPDDEVRSTEAYVYWLMDRDRKSTGLKSLQGRIWEAGFHAGELKGRAEVYPDVRPAFVRWRRHGILIAIFSSGSIQAQRNLFANTTAGDLSPFLYDYFDTKTGPKRDPNSYRLISTSLHQAPGDVLFVSDVTAELDAARDAGMRTALCVRDASARINGNGHVRIRSFDELA
ncbi:MAG TPA: acireductone synthase [Gemmatimonadales bacterium]|nr:acireductone synthase [Gemmatimonadales bacterium]